jgi:hypothetical protein
LKSIQFNSCGVEQIVKVTVVRKSPIIIYLQESHHLGKDQKGDSQWSCAKGANLKFPLIG